MFEAGREKKKRGGEKEFTVLARSQVMNEPRCRAAVILTSQSRERRWASG